MATDPSDDRLICPSCHRRKVIWGTLHSLPNGKAAFTLPGLQVGFWTLDTHSALPLPLEKLACLCVECGHLWTQVDLEAVIEKVRRFGSAELKEHVFGPGADLPRPAEAPAVDPQDLPTPSGPDR